jgi:hypothetical protein
MFRGDDLPPRSKNVSHLSSNLALEHNSRTVDIPHRSAKRSNSAINAFVPSTHELYDNSIRKRRSK